MFKSPALACSSKRDHQGLWLHSKMLKHRIKQFPLEVIEAANTNLLNDGLHAPIQYTICREYTVKAKDTCLTTLSQGGFEGLDCSIMNMIAVLSATDVAMAHQLQLLANFKYPLKCSEKAEENGEVNLPPVPAKGGQN